jgi:pyridoxal phosphate enzyme (YggS family)
MLIKQNLVKIKFGLTSKTRLVAVSKNQSVEAIKEAYNAGQRIFGENKAQELTQKQPLLPADIEWHFVGHLQTNKVKYIAPFVSLIHSIDSLSLLYKVNRCASKYNRIIPCLLQFHIATEETKFGLNLNEALAILKSAEYKAMKNINIAGLMGMASLTDDDTLVNKEFATLKHHFDFLKANIFDNEPTFCELSMGMSGDYQHALKHGSTLIRIGTGIFGDRIY